MHLTLSLPMLPLCDQRQSANVALMRLGHVACLVMCITLFCDISLQTREITSAEDLFLANKPGNGKKNHKKCYFLNFKASKINFTENCGCMAAASFTLDEV